MKILLIEDHKMLAQCLQSDLEAQGAFWVDWLKDLGQLEKLLTRDNYDLILIDINLNGIRERANGLVLAQHLIKTYGAKILILSGYLRDYYIQEAKRIGCYGFVSKEETAMELAEKIKGVCLKGERYFPKNRGIFEPLTPSELKILRLYASGKTRKEVAEMSFMAMSSLSTVLNRIYAKLGVKNYQEMVRRAQEIGYIDAF